MIRMGDWGDVASGLEFEIDVASKINPLATQTTNS
jgi:hypothetical protein